METVFYRNLGLAVLISAVLMISACATVKPEEAVSENTTAVTKDVSQNAVAETEERFSKTVGQVDTAKSVEQAKRATQVSTDNAASQQNITAKINKHEKRVKIKSVASNKSRTVARLQGGKKIEILEEKGNWLKIRWQEKDKTWEGWSRKEHIDMTPDYK